MEKPSLKKNYLYNITYQLLLMIIPLVTAPYLSRVLGESLVGVHSYITTIVSYFVLFGGLGISSYGFREIARNREDKQKTSKTFWELILLKFMMFTIAIVGYCILIAFSTNYSKYYAVLIISLLASMFDITWFFQGLEEFKKVSIRNTIFKLLNVTLIFTCVKGENALLIYLLVSGITEITSAIITWTLLKDKIVKVSLKELQFKPHLKQTISYFIPAIAISIYTMLDKVMLKWIVNIDAENGYYEQTRKIIGLMETIVFSLNAVMGARMSLLYKEGKLDEMKQGMLKSFDFIFLITTPMVFGIAAISCNFVPLFFGPGYDKVAYLLPLMAPIVMIIAISNCLGGQYLTPSGQINKTNRVIILGAAVNLILNIILIPRLKSYGAIIASVCAELVITIAHIIMSRKFIKFSEIIKYSYKRLFASILMFGIVFYLGQIMATTVLNVVLQVVIGCVVYAITLFAMKDKLLINETKNILKIFKK